LLFRWLLWLFDGTPITQISIENMCTYVMKFNVGMFPRHFSDVRMFSYRGVCFQNIVYLLVVIHRFRMCHTPSS
jgi:hypothetical protein